MTSRLVSASLLVMFLASAATLRLRCPRRWIRYGSDCFLVVDEENTWSEAHEKCHQRNGHLAVLENLSENTFMASRAKDAFPNYHGKLLWIGLRAQDGSWEWPGNQSSTYWNWEGARAPDAHDTYCAVLVPRNGRWRAMPCTPGREAGFVCMRDAVRPRRPPSGGTTPAPATTTTRPTTRPEATPMASTIKQQTKILLRGQKTQDGLLHDSSSRRRTIVSEADHAKDVSKDIDRAQDTNTDPDSPGKQLSPSPKPEMSLIVATAVGTLVVVMVLVVILIKLRTQHRPPGGAQAPSIHTTDSYHNVLYDDTCAVKEPCDNGALDEKRKLNAAHSEENIYTEIF